MILFMVFGVVYTALTWYHGNTKIETNPDLMDGFIMGTYVILVLSILLALFFPIMGLFTNFRKSSKMLIAFVGLVVLFLIVYALASGTPPDAKAAELYEKMHVSATGSKLVGAGLMLTYILAGVAVLVMIFASVRTVLKK